MNDDLSQNVNASRSKNWGPDVQAFRDQLRLAQRLEEDWRFRDAAHARDLAEEHWREIVEGLTPRIRRYAGIYFGTEGEAGFEDFLIEFEYELHKRLKNLREQNNAWQSIFNRCFKCLAINIAKRVRNEYHLLGESCPETHGYELVSLEKPVNGSESTRTQTLSETQEDSLSEDHRVWIEARGILGMIEKQLGRRYLDVVIFKMKGLTMEEVASRCGISVRSAQTYHNEALKFFKKHLF